MLVWTRMVGIVLVVSFALFVLSMARPPVLFYDDGLTFSWEEAVDPLDLLSFLEGLPEDQEQEIDERTARQLFEDVIQRVLNQMQITGGKLEEILRQDFFHFIPEYEYYFPPYAEDFSQRTVRWPVKMKWYNNSGSYSDIVVSFEVGREYDNDRKIEIDLVNTPQGMKIKGIFLTTQKYVPLDEKARPKKEELVLVFKIDKEGNCEKSAVGRVYYNSDGTKYDSQKLYMFSPGNPEPTLDNANDEPPVDLTGLDILFKPGRMQRYYEDWETYDQEAFQTLKSIIDLCKLQLNLTDNGYELERILWKDFLDYDRAVKVRFTTGEIGYLHQIEIIDDYKSYSLSELLDMLKDSLELEPVEMNKKIAEITLALRDRIEHENLSLEELGDIYVTLVNVKYEAWMEKDVLALKTSHIITRTLKDIVKEVTYNLDTPEVREAVDEAAEMDLRMFKGEFPSYPCDNCYDFTIADITREASPQEGVVVYQLDLGNLHEGRRIYLTFTKEIAENVGYEYGLKQISWVKPVRVEYVDEHGERKEGTGEEVRSFTFDYTLDYVEGRDPTEIVGTYERILFDPRGYAIEETAQIIL